MKLRIYRPGDLEEIYQLFYDTVHFVNRADYSPEQLDAWAPRQMDRSRWEQSLAEHETWVAWEEGRIVGFGDLAQNGYLDRLYVRKDSVRKGVASALLHRLEAEAGIGNAADGRLGRPYIERRGAVRPSDDPHRTGHGSYSDPASQDLPLFWCLGAHLIPFQDVLQGEVFHGRLQGVGEFPAMAGDLPALLVREP